MRSVVPILLASCVSVVSGHGYMTSPKVRNIYIPPYKYEPQSLGAAGPGQQITICGKGADNFISGKDELSKMPEPGSEYEFQAKISAAHEGYMVVRVCPFIDEDTTRRDLKECIRLATKEGSKRWELGANKPGLRSWKAVLPSKAELEALPTRTTKPEAKGVFTIQWRWHTANSCKPSDTFEERSNCNEEKCCSEVFANCADVIFKGIQHKIDAKPVEPRPRPRPRPPTGGGDGSGASGCVATAGWAGQEAMDAWCGNFACGSDPGETCDCSCTGGGGGGGDTSNPEPEPEPDDGITHVVKPNPKAAKKFKGLEKFCQLNKDYYCDTMNTQDVAPQLCECYPVKPRPSPRPTPKPSPTPTPEPEPEPEDDGADEDSVTDNDCKGRCQKVCVKKSGGVAINQVWGGTKGKNGVSKGRFIACKCSDGTPLAWKGCECRHGNCPKKQARLMETAHSTKFAGGVQKTVEIAAHGETVDME